MQAYNAQNPKPVPAPSDGPNLSFSVNIGGGHSGTGGSSHAGGTIDITNDGSVTTAGPQSTGILAQSIGGGGGMGGAATPASGSVDRSSRTIAINGIVGGDRGTDGAGGSVTVTSNGTVETAGDLAFGIHAQSIGGGGGIGGTTIPLGGTVAGSSAIWIGGGGGSSGNGGAVTVTLSPGAAQNHINTTGNDAIGIVAQSIGGGGGTSFVMTADSTLLPSPSRSQYLPQNVALPVILNASNVALDANGVLATGRGGNVTVQLGYNTSNYGYLQTFGTDAHGVLAQSIGGGGGHVVGNNNVANAVQQLFSRQGYAQGDGGTVAVSLDNRFNIGTYGAGAVGVLAQSIGGGGGLFGGMNNVSLATGTQTTPPPSTNPRDSYARFGQGGNVSVSLAGGAAIVTRGYRAHGIFAQSFGGGGGIVDQPDGTGVTFAAATPYTLCQAAGCTGAVTVTVDSGSLVEAQGNQAYAVYVQSRGNGINDTAITVGPNAVVRSSFSSGSAVYLDGAGTNTVTVLQGGTIDAEPQGGGVAIEGSGSATISNAGTIRGAILLNNGSSTFNNLATGTYVPLSIVALGRNSTFNNAGTIDLTQGSTVPHFVTTFNNTGRIVTITDHVAGRSSRLDVEGRVSLGGTIEVRPIAVANRPVTVLTATEGLTLQPGLTATRTHLFGFDAQAVGNTLQIQPRAEFTAAAGPLGSNQKQVAAHLQQLWDSGANLNAGFTALAGVNDNAAYGRGLNSLSGQTVGAIAAFRYSSSHSFVTTMYGGCPTTSQAGLPPAETNCVWSRILGSTIEQASTGGALGYRTNAQTLQFGSQWQIAPNWFLGGSLAYEISQFKGNDSTSKVSGDGLLGGVILQYRNGPWLISNAFDVGYGWYDSRRSIVVGPLAGAARASPTAWHAGIHSRIAYQVPLGGWYVQPFVDLHANYVRSGAYTETGATPFNLAVESEGSIALAAAAAVEVGGRIAFGGTTVLRPYASVGVGILSNDNWAVTARFAGQPSSSGGFRTSTPVPDVLAKIAIGAEILSSANWDVRVQYNADLGDRYSSHTGVGRLAYRF